MAYDYDLIHVAVDDGVAIATIDAPPMNVMTIPLYLELARLLRRGRGRRRRASGRVP